MDEYISINKIAELKGLKRTRSIRLAINQGKYIAREVEVRVGKSYKPPISDYYNLSSSFTL